MGPMDIERCSTGVQDLDDIMGGGYPVGHVILVAGGSGMGKTTLGFQFLCDGARNGEPGAFISITEPTPMLKRTLASYEFYDQKYVEEGTLSLLDLRAIAQKLGAGDGMFGAAQAKEILDIIGRMVSELGIRRLVIDSITAICQWIHEPAHIRDFVFRLGLVLSEIGCTTLLTSETPPRKLQYSMFGVEEFISDGIIFLSEIERQRDLLRTAQVIKMRGTSHRRAKYFMELSDKGITLTPMLTDMESSGA